MDALFNKKFTPKKVDPFMDHLNYLRATGFDPLVTSDKFMIYIYQNNGIVIGAYFSLCCCKSYNIDLFVFKNAQDVEFQECPGERILSFNENNPEHLRKLKEWKSR